MSKEYFDIWTKRFEHITPEYAQHPREDYHLVSAKFPIFIVADGVTLKRDAEGNYPVPSGAGKVAQIFCEKVIEEAEKMYTSFSESDIPKLFLLANTVARDFNDSQGIVEGKLNYRDFDYFSATTSFALIKDGALYWWSLHDAGVQVIDSHGSISFRSPKVTPNKEKFFVDQKEMSETELNKAIRSTYRNKLDVDGKPFGYGVVTGEESAVAYLSSGSFVLPESSSVLIFTDGFENYPNLDEFNNLFASWTDDIEQKLDSLSLERIKESPALYGQERTIVAVRV